MEHVQQKLKRENAKLRMELEDLRCQYRQLVSEGPEEKFGERRVSLLKAQLMQLERQVVLLSEGLSSQVCRCQDVERALDPLTHALKSMLCSDTSLAEVTVCRSELTRLVEMCSAVRQTLHRNNKVNTVEGLAMPWVLTPPSLPKQPVTLLDLCYGRTESISLQYVSGLESRLSQLFRLLLELKHSVTHLLALQQPAPSSSNAPGSSPDLAPPCPPPRLMYERLLSQTSVCLSALHLCCADLLPLSLIGPQTSQGELGQSVCVEWRVEDVMSLLPSLSRGAQQKATQAAQALTHTHNHAHRMACLQLEAAEAELQFLRRLSSFQANQSQQLLQDLRHAYCDFQNNIQQSVCDPLRDVLSSYDTLVISASEEDLKVFLSVFERNQSELRDSLQALSPSQEHGDEVLAQCGRNFLLAANRLRRQWEEQRDRAAVELKNLQHDSAPLRLDPNIPDTHTLETHTPDTHTFETHTPDTHTLTPAPKAHAGDAVLDHKQSNHSLLQIALADENTPDTATSSNQSSSLLHDVTPHLSKLSVSQQPMGSQRSANQRACSKAPPRPPWQS